MAGPGLVLAVDPGTAKCGLAVVGSDGVREHQVVLTEALASAVVALLERHAPSVVLLGDGTAMKTVRKALADVGVGTCWPLQLVPEKHTTERARERYYRDHPPHGLHRLVPTGMRLPPEPYDDYAAILLAEDYLQQNQGRNTE